MTVDATQLLRQLVRAAGPLLDPEDRDAALLAVRPLAEAVQVASEYLGQRGEQSQQLSEAGRKSAEVRGRRAQVKRDLAAGRTDLEAALRNPLMAPVKVFDVLVALPRVGRAKVEPVLRDERIVATKPVGHLTERQRRRLVEAMSRTSEISRVHRAIVEDMEQLGEPATAAEIGVSANSLAAMERAGLVRRAGLAPGLNRAYRVVLWELTARSSSNPTHAQEATR